MSEERLQEIKDSLNAQYEIAKSDNKYQSVYVVLDEEQELIEEIERLNNNWNELIKWIVNNKHNENTEKRYLVVDYGTLLGKMRELKGEDK